MPGRWYSEVIGDMLVALDTTRSTTPTSWRGSSRRWRRATDLEDRRPPPPAVLRRLPRLRPRARDAFVAPLRALRRAARPLRPRARLPAQLPDQRRDLHRQRRRAPGRGAPARSDFTAARGPGTTSSTSTSSPTTCWCGPSTRRASVRRGRDPRPSGSAPLRLTSHRDGSVDEEQDDVMTQRQLVSSGAEWEPIVAIPGGARRIARVRRRDDRARPGGGAVGGDDVGAQPREALGRIAVALEEVAPACATSCGPGCSSPTSATGRRSGERTAPSSATSGRPRGRGHPTHRSGAARRDRGRRNRP